MDLTLNALINPQFISSMKLTSHCHAVRQREYRKPDSLTETEASSLNPTIVKERVLDALMDYAVENMTTFYNLIRKDFGINCNTVDCYQLQVSQIR